MPLNSAAMFEDPWWNYPRSCPAGYNGTVTFACNDGVLSQSRGKCGARCDAGAKELMDDLSLDYPDAGLHWTCIGVKLSDNG